MTHHVILIFHLLAATIWVGGHLFLAIRILPEALKKKDASILKNFKSKFEPVGMPSLLVLLVTGILMAYHYNVTFTKWFSFSNAIEKVISIKLILLFTTVLMAACAETLIFPKLKSERMFPAAFFIITVTTIAVTMLILGSLIRIGGL
ncbi:MULTISPECIES: copper resistance protein CopD [Flavobacterium]|uniref:Copper resistance protein CopD n=2 Tax=Flavobacterium TaxID=237 RepID=A0ABS2CVW1_9FLAO|nr:MULTISPECIES: copper resistance protein CopD [Flavobacterium]MBM6499029.1 copper resistance protein CopD [Flavobacterium macrobrachii]NMH24950.1 copper resistance protein CopD [Flavobacterium solisilvae]